MRILMLDLLDLAQLENKTFKINMCEINLFDVIRQAISVVKHYANLKNIIFNTDFDEKELFMLKRVMGDERRYLQILINFLSNAIKFSFAYG